MHARLGCCPAALSQWQTYRDDPHHVVRGGQMRPVLPSRSGGGWEGAEGLRRNGQPKRNRLPCCATRQSKAGRGHKVRANYPDAQTGPSHHRTMSGSPVMCGVDARRGARRSDSRMAFGRGNLGRGTLASLCNVVSPSPLPCADQATGCQTSRTDWVSPSQPTVPCQTTKVSLTNNESSGNHRPHATVSF